jgi:hypothetical protein
VPTLLSPADEGRNLFEVINPVLHDLVIIPITQVARDGELKP